MRELTGLFLGAGASYQLGMPLVWELTAEIRNWLTPQKLRQLNVGWCAQGSGHSNPVIEDFVSVLTNSSMHYEAILGYLETKFRRRRPDSHEYHSFYSWMVELVYQLLYYRQVNNGQFLDRHLPLYDGFRTLAAANTPLWVFSLIRERRRQLGLSQQELAAPLGLTFQQIQKYERGSNRVSASKLYEIAAVLKVSPPYFFEGPGAPAEDAKDDLGEQAIRDFLRTDEGPELAKTFPQIRQGRLRRQVVDLVRAISETPD